MTRTIVITLKVNPQYGAIGKKCFNRKVSKYLKSVRASDVLQDDSLISRVELIPDI